MSGSTSSPSPVADDWIGCSRSEPATAEEKAKAWEDRDVTWIEEQIGKEPRLHHSINKLQRMLYDLETEGFTSFT